MRPVAVFAVHVMGHNHVPSYSNKSNTSVHDLNPEYPYVARKDDPDVMKRKVVKGGSWKDVSYYLQCGVRSYEYQTEARCYIGFRCVRSVIGEFVKKKTKNRRNGTRNER